MTTLHWLKPDDYHIRSECGRFTVTRLTVSPNVWYVAFRRARANDADRATELGSRCLPDTATADERQRAIREMQIVCEEHALSKSRGAPISDVHIDQPQARG